MTIGEILRYKDRDTYNKLKLLCQVNIDETVVKAFKVPPSVLKKIELGDSIESLMGHDSDKRVNGKIKQR